MENVEIELWKPIEFSSAWAACDTSILDDLAPSWFKKRQALKEDGQDYKEFLEMLKRQHAIETGVIERLYDLSEGITETFIREGFIESYLSHDDTNISPAQLMSYLKDHLHALDFIFDTVKNERPLSLGFIKQLHQLVARHQEFTTAINSLGQRVQISLLKGEFKQTDNNPRREDGKLFKYCPHWQVAPEMEKLLNITSELYAQHTNPVLVSAWFHHAFTQIHPFQDGNGRMARLLSSLILIRGNLFPFTVKREEKASYINALEQADAGDPQPLVTLFCTQQKRNIENALNYKSGKSGASLQDAAELLAEKIAASHARNNQLLTQNRNLIFEQVFELIGQIKEELFAAIPKQQALIFVESVFPDHEKHFWHTHQIAAYATAQGYYFNRHLPRGWFKISFQISNSKRYDLILSIHHFGFDDSTMAVGAFIEFVERLGTEQEEKLTIPMQLKPFTISLEDASRAKSENLSHYIRDVVKLGITIIANELG